MYNRNLHYELYIRVEYLRRHVIVINTVEPAYCKCEISDELIVMT